MAMIGKLAPARPCAFSRSLARWVISSVISPLGTECLDILSPPPGTSEVINQVERDNSRDTKIAARLTCMATRPGRGPHAGIVASHDWLAAAPSAAPAALHRTIGSLSNFGHPQLVRSGRAEIAIDQVGRGPVVLIAPGC